VLRRRPNASLSLCALPGGAGEGHAAEASELAQHAAEYLGLGSDAPAAEVEEAMSFDASSGMAPGPGFVGAVDEVGSRSARVARMLWRAMDAVQSTSTPGHDFLQSLDTEDHLPAGRQYAQSGLWLRIHNLTSYTCGRAMKATRRAREKEEEEEAAAAAPTKAANEKSRQQQGGSFRDFFMDAVAGACEGDLESIRKNEQLTDSSVAQLVGCLEAGAQVFGDLEQQVCGGLRKPAKD